MDNYRYKELPPWVGALRPGQILTLFDPSTDTTYRFNFEQLIPAATDTGTGTEAGTPTTGHTQNTDLGTNSATFDLNYAATNENTSGATVLVFNSFNGGRKAAIRYFYDQGAGNYIIQQTLNYTASDSDVWQPLGEKGEPGADHYQTWLKTHPGGTVAEYEAFFRGLPGPVSTVPGPVGPAGPPGYPFRIIKTLDTIEELPPGPPSNQHDAYGVRINGATHVYYYMVGKPGWEDLGSLGSITVIDGNTAGIYFPAENVISIFGSEPLSIKQAFDTLALYVLQKNSNLQTRFVLTNDLTNTVQLC